MNQQFANDIKDGLNKQNKSIPSKYFYDEKGSALFSQIMQLPEYYLTNAEFEIFKNQSKEILNALITDDSKYFNLIELGAGDGLKTIELLRTLIAFDYNFDFYPIDISQKALDQIKNNIKNEFPTLEIHTKKGDYFKILNEIKNTEHKKVLMFLGSNLGNMTDEQANRFLHQLSLNLQRNDKILLGVDLIKSKEIVLPAYNDNKGVTRDFNLNLLRRINREFNADFKLENFEHEPEYNEDLGIAKSFLKSKVEQNVNIKNLNFSVQLNQNERIATEVSRKYNDEIVKSICESTGLSITHKFTDSKKLFANYVLEKVK